MKYAFTVTALAMFLAPGLPAAQQPGHFFCYGQRFPAYGSPESKQPPVVYIAPVFDAPGASIGTVSSEFKAYLRQKHNLNASTSVSCATYPTVAAAQAARQKQQADVKYRKQTEIDETWTYSPNAPSAQNVKAAPAANAQKPAPPVAQKAAAPAAAKPVQTAPAAATPAAAAPAAQPAKLVDPRIAQIPEPFRTTVQNEASHQARGYCVQNVRAFIGVDCDKFAKTLLEYRIAHAADYHPLKGGQDDGGFRSINSLIVLRKLPCPDCLESAKVEKDVRELTLGLLQPELMAKRFTQAQADAIADCAVKKYPELFKNSPHPTDTWRELDEARNACSH